MELNRLNKKQLKDLLHHLVEAEAIMNIDGIQLNEMDAERDNALIHLNCMKICVFNEIASRKRKENQRQAQAKKRIKAVLMACDSDLTEFDADDIIYATMDLINGAESMDEVEAIWDAEFGIEMDDLNDLMGW